AIASVCGTADDPQIFQDQVDKLEAAGAVVTESNARATKLAVEIVDYLKDGEMTSAKTNQTLENDKVYELIATKPRVINVGLKNFAEAINEHGGEVVQYQWEPIAGGNERLAKILEKLK